MRKLFKKRALAYLIDVFLFAFVYELFRKYIARFVLITNTWGYFVIIIPFLLRDLIFRNGSVGKKITGLIVVDNKWDIPGVGIIIKRAAITSFGHILLYRFRLLNENWEMACLAELEWEYSRFKARVVEKKVFKALKEKTFVDGIVDIDKMNQLYEKHLYSEYS